MFQQCCLIRSQPEVMSAAVRDAVAEIKRQGKEIPVGVYANAFPAQSKGGSQCRMDEIRADLGPDAYLVWAQNGLNLAHPLWWLLRDHA